MRMSLLSASEASEKQHRAPPSENACRHVSLDAFETPQAALLSLALFHNHAPVGAASVCSAERLHDSHRQMKRTPII